MKILVTGVAGFIGYHLAKSLINANYDLVGIDNLNSYYDLDLKKARLTNLKKLNFSFYKIDICDQKKLENIFLKNNFDVIIHLAAQAGVRYSIEKPQEYIQSNINGFFNILELSRYNNIKHLIFASSSSIYGENENLSFEESQITDSPKNLYAASKKSNELISYSYANLFKLPCTGLRFFTVYGPWGRPDMAPMIFAKSILSQKPIDVFNNGDMFRDFTYIDDIVNGVIKVLDIPATSNSNWNGDIPDNATSMAPWRIYNIGNNKPVQLMDYIDALEKALGKKAKINFLPLQQGDVPDTYANVDNLNKKFNYKPSTSVAVGVSNFVKWYKNYYKI